MVKNIKLIITLMMIILIIFAPISNASNIDSIFQTGDDFIEEGKKQGNTVINEGQLQTTVNDVYNILFTIGIALSVLIGAILGIKFMMGSVEEQAKIKETLLPYAIGCIVVFGAFGIWKIIITIGGNVF